MAKWLILTGSGVAVRGRFEGTKAQVTKYCKDHYMPHGYKMEKELKRPGYKIVKDNSKRIK